MKVAIVGGGAAGFFAAARIRELVPKAEIAIFEKGSRPLRKVSISGGGRCNCTNTFEHVGNLREVYPRGYRLMQKLFHVFSPADARDWFENHGVPLVALPNGCIFPASNTSESIVECLLRNVGQRTRIETNTEIADLSQLSEYDQIIVTTGGGQTPLLGKIDVEMVECVPSLYAFKIDDTDLQNMQGIVAENVRVRIAGTKFATEGDLLITCRGMSGPAILKLSSYAARNLAENNYSCNVCVNWTGLSEKEVANKLNEQTERQPKKQITNIGLGHLPSRLWTHIVHRAGITDETICGSLNDRLRNRLLSTLTADTYEVAGRDSVNAPIVTCGGISLQSVESDTLRSVNDEQIYFAGEVLDVDGITGGYNLQAAWTTGYVVGNAICNNPRKL